MKAIRNFLIGCTVGLGALLIFYVLYDETRKAERSYNDAAAQGRVLDQQNLKRLQNR